MLWKWDENDVGWGGGQKLGQNVIKSNVFRYFYLKIWILDASFTWFGKIYFLSLMENQQFEFGYDYFDFIILKIE